MRYSELTESEENFYLREVERSDGAWLWQYGLFQPKLGRILWNAGTYKMASGATMAATKRMMNPNNSASDITSKFFKNPVVVDRVPITDRSNPFCMD